MVSLTTPVRVDATDKIRELENIELTSGHLTAEQYGELMALYLLSGLVCEAKMLWIRLPVEQKGSDGLQAKLRLVWLSLWERDYPGLYGVVESQDWPVEIKPLMRALVMKLKGQMLDLLGRSYNSISLPRIARLLNISESKALEVCEKMNWPFEQDLIHPKPVSASRPIPNPNEGQLSQFTATVSFLEQ